MKKTELKQLIKEVLSESVKYSPEIDNDLNAFIEAYFPSDGGVKRKLQQDSIRKVLHEILDKIYQLGFEEGEHSGRTEEI